MYMETLALLQLLQAHARLLILIFQQKEEKIECDIKIKAAV